MLTDCVHPNGRAHNVPINTRQHYLNSNTTKIDNRTPSFKFYIYEEPTMDKETTGLIFITFDRLIVLSNVLFIQLQCAALGEPTDLG